MMRGAACWCVAGWYGHGSRQEDSSTVYVRLKKAHITWASKEGVPASRVCYSPPDSKPVRGRCQRTGQARAKQCTRAVPSDERRAVTYCRQTHQDCKE